MADHKTYLASKIISEEQIVTYRLLSRALKIHVNLAKEILHEFHWRQNGKKPGTIHATYLISGTKRKDAAPATNHRADGEDEYMQSSPFMSSSLPQAEEHTEAIDVTSISLTREEDLDVVRSQYERISSIHIYSLGPHSLKDLQVITDTDREIQTLTSTEDPLSMASTYGTITNDLVRRRTAKRPSPGAAAAPPGVVKSASLPKPKQNEAQTAPQNTSSATEKKSQPSNAKDFFAKSKGGAGPGAKLKREASNISSGGGGASSREGTPAPPAASKRDPSSIFEAFAKAKPKETRKQQEGKKKEDEDSEMQDKAGLSDDGDEDEYPFEEVKTGNKPSGSEGEKSMRREREERLKAMMDIDDVEEAKSTPKPEPKPELEEAHEPEPEPERDQREENTLPVSRRKGRRRVTKKRTFKDEDGYLVTKEELAWESFSEDEPAPVAAKPKPKVPPAPAPAPPTKAKKVVGKQAGGDIMSFFGKK